MTIAQKLSTLISSTMGLTTAQQGLALTNLGAGHYNLVNGKLVESHASNAATFAIKTLAGNDPSALDPVYCRFPDASALTITSALSLTMPNQAMPGAGIQTRFWFALVNDAGTPRLVIRRCVYTGTIAGFDPRGILSAISPPASASCTNYASATITDKPYRIIAFVDYETILPANSSWTTSPTRIMLVGPDTSLPGDVIQRRQMQTAAQIGIQSGSSTPTNIVIVIASTSVFSAFQVHVTTDLYQSCGAAADTYQFRVARNGSTISVVHQGYGWAATVVIGQDIGFSLLDFPLLAGNVTYQVYANLVSNGSNIVYVPWVGGEMEVHEIMV